MFFICGQLVVSRDLGCYVLVIDQVAVLIPKGMVNKKRSPVVGGPLFV